MAMPPFKLFTNEHRGDVFFKLWIKVLFITLIFALVQATTPPSTQKRIERAGNPLPTDSSDDHCNKTVDIYVDIQSPPLTKYNRYRPLTCWYRFKSIRGIPKEWVLKLTFKKFKVGTLINSTHCDGGYLQIVDGNSKTDVSNRREPGMFCGEAEQPQTFISETSYVKVVFHTDNFTDQTYFAFDSRAETEVFSRYGQHPELYPNRRGEIVQGSYCERDFRDCRLQTCYVQSPAFPGVYPRALKCRYRLHTRQPFIKLYLQNEAFAVDGQRCENLITCPIKEIGSGFDHCPYDSLAVYDGRDENAPIIGQFCGMGKFPFSIIGTSQHMYVEFVSSPAGPLLNTGFHFNVGNWPGHVESAGQRHGACDWLLSSNALKLTSASEGIFLSVAHWYPPNTSCNYHIQGIENEIVRLYFPSFRINRIEAPIVKADGDCAESLTIYDADYPDPARVIKTFCDTFSKPLEKVDFVSTGRSMFVRFVSKTGSYSGSSLYYWGHYDFFNNTKFGSGVPNTLCDEVFYAWEHPNGILRSPLNTLIYKRIAPTSDLRCQYKFVNDKRAFARVIIEMISISFKESPYNVAPCTRCHEERVDKIIIWEEKNKTQQRLACFCDNIPRPVRIISSDSQMNLEMMVLGQYATQHYFKYANTLFTANYEFVHPPICGPINLGPKADGELIFPYKNAFGLPLSGASNKNTVKCIWELKVSSQRDLWLSVDKAKFGIYGSCEVGKIEVYIAGRLEPRFIVCPENATAAKDLPIISAGELGDNIDEALPVIVQYTGDNRYPGKSAFRLVWTELQHLPRNSDGSISSAQMHKSPCDFVCPGNPSICLPKHLLCNGIVNCPNATSMSSSKSAGDNIESLIMNIEETLQTHGIFNLKNAHLLNDESPELCRHHGYEIDSENDEYANVKWALIVAGSCFVAVMFIAVMFKMCKRGTAKNQ